MSGIHRHVYRAQSKPDCANQTALCFRTHAKDLKRLIHAGQLLTASVFSADRDFFIYYESVQAPAPSLNEDAALGDVIAPDRLFDNVVALLEPWPGQAQPRPFVPMMDIFHDGAPASAEQWRRRQPVQRTLGRLARLKPELYSSYIFYHYQLQEERPNSFDKYALISVHEDLMFFYQELPAIVEPTGPGRLSTRNTPEDWQAVMRPHFAPWTGQPDGQEIWRDAAPLIQEVDDARV